MKATEAITQAKEHLNIFRPLMEGLRVEAVNAVENTNNWVVVLSFYDDDSAVPSAILASRGRVYKKVEMNSGGELVSISNTTK